MKIVINRCFGGFGLSGKAIKYIKNKQKSEKLDPYDMKRNDPLLIEAVETLGEDANGEFAELKIVDVPDGVEWEIEEYDGAEHIAEKHRIWQ